MLEQFQVAISPQPVVRSTLCFVLRWVFGDGGSNGAIFDSNKFNAAILDNFEWPCLRNASRSRPTLYLYSAHRAVIFAIAQLSCIFHEHLTFYDQIWSLSKSCYSYIRQLRCIHPYLDSKTASTIAVSIVHSKLDYCNSNHSTCKTVLNPLEAVYLRFRKIVVEKAPKSSLVTPILRSLHWLKINERIEYKLLSLTYKVLTTSQPD